MLFDTRFVVMTRRVSQFMCHSEVVVPTIIKIFHTFAA